MRKYHSDSLEQLLQLQLDLVLHVIEGFNNQPVSLLSMRGVFLEPNCSDNRQPSVACPLKEVPKIIVEYSNRSGRR